MHAFRVMCWGPAVHLQYTCQQYGVAAQVSSSAYAVRSRLCQQYVCSMLLGAAEGYVWGLLLLLGTRCCFVSLA
jgi:hypothetical protein